MLYSVSQLITVGFCSGYHKPSRVIINPLKLKMDLTLTDRNKQQEVIHWVSKTNHSNVPIAAPASPSLHGSRNSMRPRVSPTSQSAASPVDKHANARETMVANGKCLLLPAHNAARKLKSPSSHVKADRFIATNASIKLRQPEIGPSFN